MNALKILYHHRIASKDGQYVHIEEIINSLTKQGHDIVMVAPEVAEGSDFGSSGGWVDDLKAKLPGFVYELLEFAYAFYDFFKLAAAIIKHKPDVIYERYNLFLPSGIWASKLFKVPLILEVNAPLYQERKKFNGISLDALAKWTQQYCWNQADITLPVTNVLADSLREVNVPEHRIDVIANGINLDSFGEVTAAPNLPINLAGKLVIGFVGFCREWHGLDRVLDTMAAMNNPNLVFIVIGDGPAIEPLKQQAQALGLSDQMHATGLVSRADMPKYLNTIEIALQPDVVAYASPLKMIEYLAMGKVILAPNSPNIKELLTHEDNALLFDIETPASFGEGLAKLCEDATLREQLAIRAAETITEKKLTWDSNAERIVAHAKRLYEQ
ncbi:glycosyltransferase family 4 protein [Echinimonas agarilytica]|uniref:Glycosyltransferase family 4 protein n=1 Tax=Echinimonas agarilytica TaxID=1215918 RepID=A0AA41WCV3_9GAMM|nr:glycosyltransferase family 4 protein [Echinimonas agarilytica]MCM2681479.1 glycosyltransferase family 4 protein [Echinimonas agarilytica]